MRILVTNDDGVRAPGLAALVAEFEPYHDLTIVAPASEMSAVSHSLTIRRPLQCDPCLIGNLEAIAVHGTPVDCVKLALDQFTADARPDCVVSGINQGPNTGINIFYSGTVAAAMEATLMGVPAIAVSLASFSSKVFDIAARVARHCAEMIHRQPLPPGVLLNVNVPSVPLSEIRGIRQTVQGAGRYRDSFIKRIDPAGNPYFWLTGNRIDSPLSADEDDQALSEHFISVTPLRSTLNAHEHSLLDFNDACPWLSRIAPV